MGSPWNGTIILFIILNVFRHTLCNPLSDVLNPDTDMDFIDDTDTPQKRLSKFVRIGRALSSFVRIGKSDPDLAYMVDDVGDDDEEDVEKRKSAFVRIGRGDEDLVYPYLDKRLSSFVRIGRDMEDGDSDMMTPEKRGGAFIRMGKFPSSAYIRHRFGRIHSIQPQPYYRRSGRIGHSSFIRIGKRDTTEALNKIHGADDIKPDDRRYFRIGKELEDEDFPLNDLMDMAPTDKRYSKFVRIGRGLSLFSPEELYRSYTGTDTSPIIGDKRMSKFVRIGKDHLNDEDKRSSSFVRIGKDYSNSADKRMSKFVRIGKNFNNTPDKRMSKFVRIGKNFDNTPDKRMSKFVRIGKNYDSSTDKRMSKFVRIGKDNAEKRMSNFVRIGKSDMSSDDVLGSDVTKRRTSSFVRIGRSDNTMADNVDLHTSSDESN